MRAITLHQPWASAVVLGLKVFETRSWAPEFRGRLAIHAGKAVRDADGGRAKFEQLSRAFSALGCTSFEELPFGVVIGAVDVVECYRCAPGQQQFLAQRVDSLSLELSLGNFASGRYAWELRNVVRLAQPVPARGYQKIWNFLPTPEVLALLRGQGSSK